MSGHFRASKKERGRERERKTDRQIDLRWEQNDNKKRAISSPKDRQIMLPN